MEKSARDLGFHELYVSIFPLYIKNGDYQTSGKSVLFHFINISNTRPKYEIKFCQCTHINKF